MTTTRRRRRLVGEHFRADGKPKRRFETRKEAEAFIELYGYTNLMIYGPCEFTGCNGFHLSTLLGARR